MDLTVLPELPPAPTASARGMQFVKILKALTCVIAKEAIISVE